MSEPVASKPTESASTGSPDAASQEEAARVARAEATFDRIRRRAGLVLAPVLGILAWLASPGDTAGRLAGVMAFTAVLWITEALPVAVTALFAATLTVVFGIAETKDAFAAFGNPLLFLFVGSFFIAEAMIVHGLGERFARAIGRVAHTRITTLVALSLGAFLLSMWISNSAATAVILPMALAVARASGDRRFGAALVLSIAYGSSMGGCATPIGTPPNLIGLAAIREHAHVEIGFLEWMKVGFPIGLVMLGILWVIARTQLGVGSQPVAPPAESARKSTWSRGEVAVAVAFALAVFLWIAPGVLEITGPRAARLWWRAHLPDEAVAILAAGILFVWPIGVVDGTRRAALTWSEASRIDWGTVLLFGGGILLGDLAGKTGLAARWGHALVEATGVSSAWSITLLVTAAAVLLSEATSNTATATLMVPLTISIAMAAGVDPVAPAVAATIGSSFGFMLPISTAPNAMAYGTGWVTVRQMMRAGVVFDAVGLVIILIGVWLLASSLGS